eukprot:6060921-Amphidinium_carterae.1
MPCFAFWGESETCFPVSGSLVPCCLLGAVAAEVQAPNFWQSWDECLLATLIQIDEKMLVSD